MDASRRVATRLTFLEGVGAGEGTRGGVHTPAGDMIERRMVVWRGVLDGWSLESVAEVKMVGVCGRSAEGKP